MIRELKDGNGNPLHLYIHDRAYMLNGVSYELDEFSGRCYILTASNSLKTKAGREGTLVRRRISRADYDEGLKTLKELLRRAEQRKAAISEQAVEPALQERRADLYRSATAAMAEHLEAAKKYRCLDNVREEYIQAQGLGNWLVRAHIFTLAERSEWVDRVYEVYRDSKYEAALAEAKRGAELGEARDNFAHGPEAGAVSRGIYALGLALERECPDNDCGIYLNTFRMARSVDGQMEQVDGWARKTLAFELNRLYSQLKKMYDYNHTVALHRRKLEGREALAKTRIGRGLSRAGLEDAVIQVCERFPYLAKEVRDSQRFAAAVLGLSAARAMLTDQQRRKLARLAGTVPCQEKSAS